MTELERIKNAVKEQLEIEEPSKLVPTRLLQDALRAIESLEWTNTQLAKENKRKLKENWKKSIERVYKISASNSVEAHDVPGYSKVIPLDKLQLICEQQLERGDTLC